MDLGLFFPLFPFCSCVFLFVHINGNGPCLDKDSWLRETQEGQPQTKKKKIANSEAGETAASSRPWLDGGEGQLLVPPVFGAGQISFPRETQRAAVDLHRRTVPPGDAEGEEQVAEDFSDLIFTLQADDQSLPLFQSGHINPPVVTAMKGGNSQSFCNFHRHTSRASPSPVLQLRPEPNTTHVTTPGLRHDPKHAPGASHHCRRRNSPPQKEGASVEMVNDHKISSHCPRSAGAVAALEIDDFPGAPLPLPRMDANTPRCSTARPVRTSEATTGHHLGRNETRPRHGEQHADILRTSAGVVLGRSTRLHTTTCPRRSHSTPDRTTDRHTFSCRQRSQSPRTLPSEARGASSTSQISRNDDRHSDAILGAHSGAYTHALPELGTQSAVSTSRRPSSDIARPRSQSR